MFRAPSKRIAVHGRFLAANSGVSGKGRAVPFGRRVCKSRRDIELKKRKKKQSAKLATLIRSADQAFRSAKYDQAEALCKQAISLDETNKNAVMLMVQIASAKNRMAEAGALLQGAIERDPTDPQLYISMAQLLIRVGRADEAVGAYRRAIGLAPQLLDLRIVSANLLCALGRYPEAIQECRQALELRSDYAPLYYNLGIALAAFGQPMEALASYERAISLNPDYHVAHFNLANLKRSLGDMEGALASYLRSAQLDPEQKLYLQKFSDCLGAVCQVRFDDEIDACVRRCLEVSGINHRGLIGWVLNRTVSAHVPDALLNAHDSGRRRSLIDAVRGRELHSLLNHEPLRMLLERVVINNCDFERFLTDLRFAFLSVYMDRKEDVSISEDAVGFLASLACQCYLNGFVYAKDQAEKELVDALRLDIEKAMQTGERVQGQMVALLGCYETLGSVFGEQPPTVAVGGTGEASLSRLIELQLVEPSREAGFSTDFPMLTGIEASNPEQVDRWQEDDEQDGRYFLPFIMARPAGDIFAQLFPQLARKGATIPVAPRILVAERGNGFHALMAARLFRGSSVTAVNSSRAALVFAAVQARKMGITNIEFGQADLMRLDDTLGQFDIIEAEGVLHYLPDALEGWRTLLALLRPGGLMRVGLYSDCGRQIVSAAGDIAAQLGVSPTADGVRDVRRTIMELDKGEVAYQLTRYNEFYSLASCRKLLFGKPKHWFTLPQLNVLIGQLGLAFVGFELEDPAYLRDYKMRYPLDPEAVSLDNWYQYETQQPGLFASRYQFWVRKEG
jgi:tetratricopeptide (TPR) repeat protein/SAM-dependent methyltransferase